MTSKEEIAQRLHEARNLVESLEEQYEDAEAQSHPEELAQGYLPGLPEAVTDRVYSYAYTEGHSSGLDEVETYYSDLAMLIQFVWDQALRQCPAQP